MKKKLLVPVLFAALLTAVPVGTVTASESTDVIIAEDETDIPMVIAEEETEDDIVDSGTCGDKGSHFFARFTLVEQQAKPFSLYWTKRGCCSAARNSL